MDNIMLKNFFSFRQPAWHNVTKPFEEPMTAKEAYGTMADQYGMSLEPLYSEISGSKFESSMFGIWRHPVPNDPNFRMLGAVGPDYRLIDPYRLCEIYDENIDGTEHPIETMAALGKGETFFFSTALESFSVRGDEIANYLLMVSPYTGNASFQVRVTPVRVVCQNTLIAARSASSETYLIRHDQRAETDLGLWMAGILERVSSKTETLQEIFLKMSSRRLSEAQIEEVLVRVYPEPNRPRLHPDVEVMRGREENFEVNKKYSEVQRQAVREIFGGIGVGQDTEAADGTAFGFYNAVCEWEQYKRTTKPVSVASDMMIGSRAQACEAAFGAIWDMSQMVDAVSVETKRPAKKRPSKK